MIHTLIASSLIASQPVAQPVAEPVADAARPVLAPQPAVQRTTANTSPGTLSGMIDALVSFGTRHTLSEADDPDRGIGAARTWIHEQFESFGGRLDVSFDAHDIPAGRRLPDGARVVNVVATLPGAMPEAADRVYYIIAHYDSRVSDGMDATSDAPGANDDGSGTAVVMEAARLLANTELDATIVFMATAGEEQGLYGARAHARALADEGAIVAGVLNNDTVGDPGGPDGRRARNEIRVFSEGIPASMILAPNSDEDRARARERQVRAVTLTRLYGAENDSQSRQLARFMAEVAEREQTSIRPRLIFRADRFLRGGDHTAFNEMGYPAVRLTEVYEDYTRQHQDLRTEDGIEYGDTAEFVDPAYLADVVELNVATLMHLANAPRVPPNARMIVASLTNDTTLRWDACPEPDTAGYEVVWRATTSPMWEFTRDVGSVTEATIPLSKDNWIFGVRAYDRDGYRSPVAYPAAARD